MVLQQPLQIITEKASVWTQNAIAMLPNIAVAVFILILAYFVGRLFRTLTYRWLKRSKLSDTLNTLVSTIVFLAFLLLGLIISLGVMRLEKTVISLLAGAGVLGIALAFAFQDIAANLISGIILAVKKPFLIDQLIEVNGLLGRVQDINLRTTDIVTPDGKLILIPNRKVLENPLVNYSSQKKRRVDLVIGVSYAEDLEHVKKTVERVLKKLKCRLKDTDVEVFFEEFGDSSINLVGRFWTKFTNRQADYLSAKNQAVIAVKKAFDKEGILIPWPIRTLNFDVKGGTGLKQMLK